MMIFADSCLTHLSSRWGMVHFVQLPTFADFGSTFALQERQAVYELKTGTAMISACFNVMELSLSLSDDSADATSVSSSDTIAACFGAESYFLP